MVNSRRLHFTQSSVLFPSFSTVCMSGLRRVSLHNRPLHVATYRTRPLNIHLKTVRGGMPVQATTGQSWLSKYTVPSFYTISVKGLECASSTVLQG